MRPDQCESAFPVAAQGVENVAIYPERGMTLRDYFAAQAMVGLISKSRVENTVSGFAEQVLMVSQDAFRYADAMLKVRE